MIAPGGVARALRAVDGIEGVRARSDPELRRVRVDASVIR